MYPVCSGLCSSSWLHSEGTHPHSLSLGLFICVCEALSPSRPCLCSFTTFPCIWSGLQWASSPAQPRRRKNPKTHLWNLWKTTGRSQKLVRAESGIRVSRDSRRGKEGGAGAAQNVCQVRGLKFFIRPGDQWVSDSWIS